MFEKRIITVINVNKSVYNYTMIIRSYTIRVDMVVLNKSVVSGLVLKNNLK